MNKKELIKETLNFIKKYDKLPFMEEDEFEIEYLDNEEIKTKILKAESNIKKHFETNNEYVDYLFEKRKLTYKLISKHTKLSATRVKNLLDNKIKNVTINDRRKLHIFFNKDYFPKMNKYSDMCIDCKNNKKCGQNYWADVWFCKKYEQV